MMETGAERRMSRVSQASLEVDPTSTSNKL